MTDNSDFPLITIGIVTYNAEDTVMAAVKSALDQGWPNTEIVIIDDHSTDKTVSIICALADEHKNLRVHSNPDNRGVAYNRNKIIEMAQGEFIAFFDDDDTSLPERLREQYERIITCEAQIEKIKPVICHAPRRQVYPEGAERIEQAPDMVMEHAAHVPQGMGMAMRILTGKPVKNGFGSMPTCSQMARTDVYRQVGGFDEGFRRCEDTELNVRIALAGGYFVGLDRPLVTQTMTTGSEKKLDEERRYHRMIIEKHADTINRNSGNSEFCLKWLDAKFTYLSGKRISFVIMLVSLFLQFPNSTFSRILWALPNIKFNSLFGRYHRKYNT